MSKFSIRNTFLAIILASSLQGCAVWDWIKPASDGINVDAEMTIGDKKEEVNTEVTGNKTTTHNVADQVYNTYQEMNEAAPWWIILLLILGWVLPTPGRMGKAIWHGILHLFRRN
jgi:hypothetical protein